MNHTTMPTLDQIDAFEPSAEDLDDYRTYLASRADMDYQDDGPTPIEVLDLDRIPDGADEDDFGDWGPWWEDLPDMEPTDGVRYGLVPECEPVAFAPPRFAVEVDGRPEVIDDGYRVVDHLTGLVVHRCRSFVEAEGVAAGRNRGSSWNPEADLFANA